MDKKRALKELYASQEKAKAVKSQYDKDSKKQKKLNEKRDTEPESEGSLLPPLPLVR